MSESQLIMDALPSLAFDMNSQRTFIHSRGAFIGERGAELIDRGASRQVIRQSIIDGLYTESNGEAGKSDNQKAHGLNVCARGLEGRDKKSVFRVIF